MRMGIPRPESALAKTIPPGGGQHWPGLDALRGLAMLLGVVLHASVSYMPHAMPDLVWAARDRSVSPFFDWLFWSIHAFRLPLFFALAGFFTVILHDARGTRGYLVHRSRRLLVPLLGAALILLPVTFAAWAGGWLLTGLCTLDDVRRMQFQPAIQANLYGPAHLWFLEYLYLMCLAFAGACWLRGRLPTHWRNPDSRPVWFERFVGSGWFPLVPAVPAALLVGLAPEAICNFRNTFIPEPLRFAYYGIFFVTGTCLGRVRGRLERCLVAACTRQVAVCVPLLLVCGLLLQEHLEHGLTGAGRLVLGVSWGLLASLSLFGLTGLALRLCPRERPSLRYLADASYWIYLVHFPLIGLIQTSLFLAPVPAALKFAAVLSLTLAVGFVSYHRFVRHTFLGEFLNGSRPEPALPPLTCRPPIDAGLPPLRRSPAAGTPVG
jgi:glucans biosynthesis protein C